MFGFILLYRIWWGVSLSAKVLIRLVMVVLDVV